MTWEDLKDMIKDFTEEQMKQSVTIYVSGVDEYYGLMEDYPIGESTDECDVLDSGSMYLRI